MRRIHEITRTAFKNLFVFKQVSRPWHIALLAALCVGIPLLAGLYTNNFLAGLLAAQPGLIILYLPSVPFGQRTRTLLKVAPFFVISYAVGLCCGFNEVLALPVFFVYTFLAHYAALKLKFPVPGSFFPIMFCSTAICQPFHPETIVFKIGFFAIGLCFSVGMAILYSWIVSTINRRRGIVSVTPVQTIFDNILKRAIVMAGFVGGALLVARLAHLENPYWVPVSSLAVMQGLSAYHARQRSFQRIMGTFLGLGLTWLILTFGFSRPFLVACVITLQFIVEMVLARNYAIGVLFVTPMAILLTEAGRPAIEDPTQLIQARFIDILIGSIMGFFGAWVMHHKADEKQSQ